MSWESASPAMRDWNKFKAVNDDLPDAQRIGELSESDLAHMKKIWEQIRHRGLNAQGIIYGPQFPHPWGTAVVHVRNGRSDSILLIGACHYESKVIPLIGEIDASYGKPTGWIYLRAGEECSFDCCGEPWLYIGIENDDGSQEQPTAELFKKQGVELTMVAKSGGGKPDRLGLRTRT